MIISEKSYIEHVGVKKNNKDSKSTNKKLSIAEKSIISSGSKFANNLIKDK